MVEITGVAVWSWIDRRSEPTRTATARCAPTKAAREEKLGYRERTSGGSETALGTFADIGLTGSPFKLVSLGLRRNGLRRE